jgi:exo-beta-1,3-glucanase (GH17 family)
MCSKYIIGAILIASAFAGSCAVNADNNPTPAPQSWQAKVSAIQWVAYSPTNADPNKGVEADVESIRQDLSVLRAAGFDGLVTYSAGGMNGREIPRLAQEQGFVGLIIGVWEPSDQVEMADAKTAAQNPIVLGYCIGNEGLDKRYKMPDLVNAMEDIKKATNKPVATTEEIDDYVDEELLNIGDWIFPNVHPYFHNLLDPNLAVDWTKAAYEDMTRRAGNRFVLFKEVGLPTAGDKEGLLSEETQTRYYQELAASRVKFVYFEAFDQPWKNSLPIEPHWGLFYSNRAPKQVILQMFP